MDRNGWSPSAEISGRLRAKYANYYGTCCFYTRFKDLPEVYKLDPAHYTLWESGNGGRSFYWGGTKSRKWGHCNDLANAAINELLGYDRPLLKFSTAFFFPFEIKGKWSSAASPWQEDLLPVKEQDAYYQEYIYFHRYVRDILYRTDANEASTLGHQSAVQYYRYARLRDGACMEIEYQTGTEDKILTMAYPLTHLTIHKFFNNIAILAMQVTREINPGEDFEKGQSATSDLWKTCLEMKAFRDRFLTCEDTLRFNELARKVYLSFRSQFKEGMIPRKVTVRLGTQPSPDDLCHAFSPDQFHLTNGRIPISTIITKLLSQFLGQPEGQGFECILDDRMVVDSFVAFAGEKPLGEAALDEHEALFYRYMYVDCLEQGYAYDEQFIKGISNQQIYRRWFHYGGLYGFTRYSSVYTGFGSFFSDEIFGYFNSIYYQLALIALYYRSSLIFFAKEVAITTRKLVKDKKRTRDSFLDLTGRFMLFSNMCWFREVTNQDQGIEIFDLYKKSFDFDAMYDQITSEIDRAEDYLETYHRTRFDSWQEKLGKGGFFVAIVAILMSYFGTNFCKVTEWGTYEWLFWIVTILSSCVLAFIAIKLWWPGKDEHKEKEEA